MKRYTDAGQYNRMFVWLVRSYTTDPATGAQIPSWSGSDVLWGSLDESPGSYADQWGTTRNSTNAKIVLRQYPAISAGDRLRDDLFGHMYIINAVAVDWVQNETIIFAYRLEDNPV